MYSMLIAGLSYMVIDPIRQTADTLVDLGIGHQVVHQIDKHDILLLFNTSLSERYLWPYSTPWDTSLSLSGWRFGRFLPGG